MIVLFAMFGEPGHHTGTFRLAGALTAAGHRVVYLAPPELAPLVEARGFTVVPFALDVPFDEHLRRLEDGTLDDCLRSVGADVLLCDTFVWYVALRAHRLGLPTINLSTCLQLHENPRIPPVVSSLRPRPTWWSAAAVVGSWKWMRLRFYFTKTLASRLFGRYRAPRRMHHLMDEFVRLARRSGYPLDEGRTFWFGEFGPRLILPEIVLVPRAFQLPGEPPDERRRWLGDFVDGDRPEVPLEPLGDDRPIVLCSLGTSSLAYPHRRRFFRAVWEMSALRRDWQVVLHVGNDAGALTLGPPEPNLRVSDWVPQLALLRRARAMATHGGMNSMMECVHFGVPMVVIPGLRDQPGNAARAVHHGVALQASMAAITGRGLADLLERAMHDSGLRRALGAMRRAVAAEGGLDDVVRLVEACGPAR